MRHQPFIEPTVELGSCLHGNVRTLSEMTDEEIRAIEAKYGMPVRPRSAEVAEQLADGRGHSGEPDGDRVDAHENAVPVVQAEEQEPA